MSPNPLDAPGCRRVFRVVEVPGKLQVQPELGIYTEYLLEAERRIGRHTPLPVDDLVQPRIGHLYPLRELRLAKTQRLDELLKEHLAWMGRWSILWKAHAAVLRQW